MTYSWLQQPPDAVPLHFNKPQLNELLRTFAGALPFAPLRAGAATANLARQLAAY